MKRIIMFVTCILIYTQLLFANRVLSVADHRDFKSIYKNFIDLRLDTVELVKEVVPLKYQYYFLKYTDPELRVLCLSIAAHESGWMYMVSHKPNEDGTIDKGPMGLNERNINDPKFRRLYFPKEYIEDNNTVYMIACINYFEKLYKEFGVSGLYSYNCGRSRYLYGTIPNKTHNYYKSVRSYAKEYNKRLGEIRKSFIVYTRYESPEIYTQVIEHDDTSKINIIEVICNILLLSEHQEHFVILEKKIKAPDPEYEIDSGLYHSTFITLYNMLMCSDAETA